MDASEFDDDGRTESRASSAVPLESDDVIELQAFNRKKDWIVERIKLLEGLPPVDVFIGERELGELRRTLGLPTHEQVRKWRAEYNTLEEETEQFDQSDMKRLKALADAAVQRRLTPEDTDLIEITFDTLQLVAGLQSLLQKRGERLDILECRLRWEDERLAARQERLSILYDFHAFITNSARWTPAVYKDMRKSDLGSSVTRRLSDASTTSFHSTVSGSASPNRSLRQRMYDTLCADAAHFGIRISTLRHVKVAAAAKSLDRFIETSDKALPDAFLDEQDRIENEAEAMDGLGKYALNVVSQWKRADHDYNEFIRDTVEAQAILDELEKAAKEPPTQQLDASFTSRASALITKLAQFSDPVVSRSFPRPVHHSFPDQSAANDKVTSALSVELSTAKNLARVAAARSKQYHDSLLTLRRAEELRNQMVELRSKLGDVRRRLAEGASAKDPQSSPPDLSTTACLDAGQHQAYVFSLPSLLKEVDQLLPAAEKSVRAARTLTTELKHMPLEKDFLSTFNETASSLGSESGLVSSARLSATTLADRFRAVRSIWSAAREAESLGRNCAVEICEGLERDRWKPEVDKAFSPLTPDTPSSRSFTIPSSPAEVRRKVEDLSSQVSRRMQAPMKSVSPHLGDQLRIHLDTTTTGLQEEVGHLRDLIKLWERVREQAVAMKSSMGEAEGLEERLSALAGDVEAVWQSIVTATTIPDLSSTETSLKRRLTELRHDVLSFKDSLPSRIPLVASSKESSLAPTTFNLSSPKVYSPITMPYTPPEAGCDSSRPGFPFDPAALDDAVRSHVNVKAANLTGALHNVEKRMGIVSLSGEVRHLDTTLDASEQEISKIWEDLKVNEHPPLLPSDSTIADIQRLLESLESQVALVVAFTDALNPRLAAAISPAQESHDSIILSLGDDDDDMLDVLIKSRDERLQRLAAMQDELRHHATNVLHKLHESASELGIMLATREREEAERRAAEKRAREEAEIEAARLTALEVERLRAEREAEERARLVAQQAELEAEGLRAETEARDRARLEAEALARREAEERERRAAEEQQRLELEEVARQERQAAEEMSAHLAVEESARVKAEEAEGRQEQQHVEDSSRAKVEASPHAEAEESESLPVSAQQRPKNVELDIQEPEASVPPLLKDAAPVPVADSEPGRPENANRPEADEPSPVEAEGGTQITISRAVVPLLDVNPAEGSQPQDEASQARTVNAADKIEEVPRDIRTEGNTGMRSSSTQHGLYQDVPQRSVLGLVPEDYTEVDDTFHELKLEHLQGPALRKDSNANALSESVETGVELDVFGFNLPIRPSSKVISNTQSKVAELRDVLLSLNLREAAYPTSEDADVVPLPTTEEVAHASTTLGGIRTQMALLQVDEADVTGNSSLKTLEAELGTMEGLIPRLQSLAGFSAQATMCDAALSQLIEHVDAYPDPPKIPRQGFEPTDTARDQLLHCRDDVSTALKVVEEKAVRLLDDRRVESECDRMTQTWEELREMANDRLDPSFVRSRSSMSMSSMNSSTSLNRLLHTPSTRPGLSRQSSTTFLSGRSSVLSASTNTNPFTVRRKAPSQASSTNRSVSGPTPRTPANRPASAAQAPTTASAARQRTGSGASARRVRESLDAFAPPSARGLAGARSRKTSMDVSPVRPRNLSLGAWDRTPRHSLGSPSLQTPKPRPKKRTYVANPKNKLDMAVGDVINKLPVSVKVQAVGNWKDQSGKYWIGDDDQPKLCFCRILRSQTVMVRVGGGWMELSKFIKSHFADLFRLLPPGPITPTTPGRSEEPWISSASLRAAKGSPLPAGGSPATPHMSLPRTVSPVPLGPKTPVGAGPAIHVDGSPFSVTSSSPGSPLAPLQFMRRADDNAQRSPTVRAGSKLRQSTGRGAPRPALPPVWRP